MADTRSIRPSIGQARKSPREIAAEERAQEALEARGFPAPAIVAPSQGPGVVAVAVNGRKVIMHLGRDKTDALFGIAALASRPEGRA